MTLQGGPRVSFRGVSTTTVSGAGIGGFHGSFHVSTSITNTANGTPAKLAGAGATTAGLLDSFTHTSPNRLTYTGTATKVFHVTLSASMEHSANNTTIDTAFAKNGTVDTNTNILRLVSANSVGAISVERLISLATNDFIEIFSDADNVGTTTMSKGNLSIVEVQGGGDVQGPGAGNSTDNAIARYNGTDGDSIQDSGVIISDADAITGVVGLTTTGPVIIDDSSLQIQEGVDTLTLTVPALTAARAVTMPDAAGEVVLDGATQTLSAKTLTAPTIAATGFTNANHAHAAANSGGTLDAAAIGAGTLVHERGGLEADVSAFTGLLAISGGATSEVDAKAELEAQIADVSDFAEADGDVFTGVHDFGGATSLEAPNGAGGTTVDAAGEFTVDTTAKGNVGHMQFHDGTAERVIPVEISKSITIEDPTTADDITFFRENKAITVREMVIVTVGSATPSVTVDIHHHTDRNNAGNALITTPTASTAAANSATTTGHVITSFDDATIPADSFVWVEIDAQSGTVDEVNITIFYTVDP